jgi:ribonuclease D
VEGSTQENGFGHFWRLAGKDELTAQQLAVLYALYQYREGYAKAKNRPVFKVISDRVLLDIAHKLPRTMETLGNIRGMNRNQLRRHGAGLLQAVEKGLKSKPPRRPARHHPNGRYMLLNDALRNWRKETARDVGVESDIVLPRDMLEEIAREEPRSLDELRTVMEDLPWRFNQYGKHIVSLIRRMEET